MGYNEQASERGDPSHTVITDLHFIYYTNIRMQDIILNTTTVSLLFRTLITLVSNLVHDVL